MSIVDTWDWDKLDTSEYDKEFKMTADMKVRNALCEFESLYNIRPNKIVMGYNLADELRSQIYSNSLSVKAAEERKKLNVAYEYEGIPINIGIDNPNNLEIGYMVKWTEEKY